MTKYEGQGWEIKIDIKGQPGRKSNGRRSVRNRKTGKPMFIKSQKALDWVESALWQIPTECKVGVGSPRQRLRISCWCRYSSALPDLSIELVKDVLEKAGVIRNDRYIFEEHNYKEVGSKDPGVLIIIEPLTEGEW